MHSGKRLAIYQPKEKPNMKRRAEQTLRFPQVQLVLLYFLTSSLLAKVYKLLLHLLSITGRLLFYWLTLQVVGTFHLWRCILQMSSAVHVLLVRKLGREVLTPAVEILQRSRAAVRSSCLYWVGALQYSAARWVLALLLVLLKQRVLMSVLSVGHQLQENRAAYWRALQPVMKQIAISLFLGCRDGFPEVFQLSAKARKYILTHVLKHHRPTWRSTSKESVSDDVTAVLPKTCILPRTSFKGPATCLLRDIPQTFVALKFVVPKERIVSGPGRYGLDITNVPSI
ncbi:hypothetical protein JRQ81_016246 [Phrynocephalus forsythii]|uniref:Uncharacterized protein n=1 Tax=Phrynocephalus forsythii TaxID=171643 RepID=A0A9Q0XY32_9SAUR|nr:hypothetical protein JRQ81_016246 [Phrynocephalus forsythii]